MVNVLVTKTRGLTPQNRFVFGYLELQVASGFVRQKVADLVVKSFAGIALPVVSEKRFKEIKDEPFYYQSVYGQIGLSPNQESLSLSLYFVNGLISEYGLQAMEAEIKKCHAGILRFFL